MLSLHMLFIKQRIKATVIEICQILLIRVHFIVADTP